MRDRSGDERFQLLDRLVGDPAGTDAQRFTESFAAPVGPPVA
ncbi:MAG: hypothetical protein ACRDRX_26920 [Pseudonocardiaceae bacterium]